MPSQTEELRRRIVADINSAAHPPGSKFGSATGQGGHLPQYRSPGQNATLRQVLAALEEAGLVHRVIGRSGGIFVSHPQVERNLSDVVGVPAFLSRAFRHTSIYVRTDRIKRPADLKGKKVALNKGSNVHYLLVKALEKAGIMFAAGPLAEPDGRRVQVLSFDVARGDFFALLARKWTRFRCEH